MRRVKWATLIAAVATLVSAGSASAGTLDREQTDVSGGDCLGGDDVAAQTFTAGITGELDQVDLYFDLNDAATSTTHVVVDITAVDVDGEPTGEPLASETLFNANLPETAEWVSFVFDTPPNVVAGTQYAIAVHTTTSPACTVNIRHAEADVYAGGEGFEGTSLTNWSLRDPATDYGFKTYVVLATPEPPAPPTPPSPVQDTDAPETMLTKHVKRTEKGKVKFRFESDEVGASFECKLKGPDLKRKLRQFRDCDSPRKYKNLDEGRFKFAVRAVDAAGNVDPTPDKDRFRVVD